MVGAAEVKSQEVREGCWGGEHVVYLMIQQQCNPMIATDYIPTVPTFCQGVGVRVQVTEQLQLKCVKGNPGWSGPKGRQCSSNRGYKGWQCGISRTVS